MRGPLEKNWGECAWKRKIFLSLERQGEPHRLWNEKEPKEKGVLFFGPVKRMGTATDSESKEPCRKNRRGGDWRPRTKGRGEDRCAKK